MGTAKIIYTETDEAPALATYSLLPVIKKFASKAGVEVEKCDISLAARIIAQFPKVGYIVLFSCFIRSLYC
ncbi:hypothetical protein EON65_44475 [archaeon]|nr:MAG: hypothetical protein EON65_44475 [archaeon]